jgi:hypothetical protein
MLTMCILTITAPATQSDGGGGSGTVPPTDSSSDDTATASDKDNAEVSEEPKVNACH